MEALLKIVWVLSDSGRYVYPLFASVQEVDAWLVNTSQVILVFQICLFCAREACRNLQGALLHTAKKANLGLMLHVVLDSHDVP